eukprot:6195002-Pleurochrysis_carterae.AAC.1
MATVASSQESAANGLELAAHRKACRSAREWARARALFEHLFSCTHETAPHPTSCMQCPLARSNGTLSAKQKTGARAAGSTSGRTPAESGKHGAR